MCSIAHSFPRNTCMFDDLTLIYDNFHSPGKPLSSREVSAEGSIQSKYWEKSTNQSRCCGVSQVHSWTNCEGGFWLVPNWKQVKKISCDLSDNASTTMSADNQVHSTNDNCCSRTATYKTWQTFPLRNQGQGTCRNGRRDTKTKQGDLDRGIWVHTKPVFRA